MVSTHDTPTIEVSNSAYRSGRASATTEASAKASATARTSRAAAQRGPPRAGRTSVESGAGHEASGGGGTVGGGGGGTGGVWTVDESWLTGDPSVRAGSAVPAAPSKCDRRLRMSSVVSQLRGRSVPPREV